MTYDPAIATRDGFVVVIDDDPTGTQMASDVGVVLSPDAGTMASEARAGRGAMYVLADTRSRTAREARTTVAGIADAARSCLSDRPVDVVLRGDSTLRGHIFDEIEAVDRSGHGALFVPAWPEGGRVTVAGVHCLQDGQRRTPVARTEFARDPDFGFRSETLTDWVHEVAPGWDPVIVALADLRSSNGGALADALGSADRRTVVIPEVLVADDLDVVLSGLRTAEARGRRPVVRAASSFAARRAGVGPRPVQHSAERVLVLCGSYTQLATEQLAALASAGHRMDWLHPGADPAGAIADARTALEATGVAVLATDRTFVRPAGSDGGSYGALLRRGAEALRGSYDCLVVKGGATCAEIARDGLGVRRALVQGQLAPGVPLWLLDCPDGGRLPYVVVPGNVGPPALLLDILTALRNQPTRSATTTPGGGQ